jgi:xylulokinase
MGHRQDEAAIPHLERAAQAVPPGAGGVLFIPYLGGMYYPQRHVDARGAFLGLQVCHDRAVLFRAVLEGVAHALHHIVDSLVAAGVEAQRVRLTGGGSRSALWRQILADELQVPLEVSAFPGYEECVGAARCAWVALKRFETVDEAVAGGLPAAAVVLPDPTRPATTLRHEYERYRSAAARIIDTTPTATTDPDFTAS